MATVALIGPDGAGKTTLARMLEASASLRCRYLYMGVDIGASNVALPTSRVAEWIKNRRRGGPEPGGPGDPARSRHGEDGARGTRRAIRATRAWLRLANRIAEELYRQLVAAVYQLRGFVVLYDRHFVFDFDDAIEANKPDSLDRRLHRRFLAHVYPRPDVVIFLDAPGAVLYARKGESTVVELERRRQAYLRQGASMPGFVRVDATLPLEDVYREILATLSDLRGGRPVPAAAEAG